MSASVFLYLSSHWYLDLGLHNALVPQKIFGYGQTTSTYVEQAFLWLVLPLDGRVYHCSELGPSLCDHKSNATYAFPRHSLDMPSFCRPTFCSIQHSRSNHHSIKLASKILWYPLVTECRCFNLGGQHQRVNLCACSLFRMVMQQEHKRFILVRAKKALRPAGWERLYYLAPKRGANTSRWKRGCEEEG